MGYVCVFLIFIRKYILKNEVTALNKKVHNHNISGGNSNCIHEVLREPKILWYCARTCKHTHKVRHDRRVACYDGLFNLLQQGRLDYNLVFYLLNEKVDFNLARNMDIWTTY